MKLLNIILLLGLLAAASCSDGVARSTLMPTTAAPRTPATTPILPPTAPAQTAPAPTFTPEVTLAVSKPLIIYHRAGGFAGVDEEWHLYADGRIIDDQGHELQVSAAAVNQLWLYIKESGFFTLAEAYLPKDPCCDRFTHVITVRDGDRQHTVTTIDQTPGAPSQLLDVIQAINSLLVDSAH